MPKHQPIMRPLALALVLAVGLAIIWAVLGTWTASAAGAMLSSDSSGVYRKLVVLADGKPVVATTDSRNFRLLHAVDGSVSVIEHPDFIINGAQLRFAQTQTSGFLRYDWNRRIAQVHEAGRPNARWYFLHNGQKDGAGYFVGYDLLTNRCIGYIGTDGRSSDLPPKDQWFPISASEYLYDSGSIISKNWTPRFLRSFETVYETDFPKDIACARATDRIWKVDLAQETVETLFEAPGIVTMAQLGVARQTFPEANPDELLAVRLQDKIVIITLAGDTLAEFVLPEKLRTRPFAFYLIAEDQAIYAETDSPLATGVETCTLTWADEGGRIQDTKEIPLSEGTSQMSTRSGALLFSTMMPVPVAATPLAVSIGIVAEQRLHPDLNLAQALTSTLHQSWPPLLGLIILAAVLSWTTVRRQRKYALPWTKTWATFVLLFGIPGYLAYLCHRKWPVRAECNECHQPTPQDHDACPFCDTPFPTPTPKGIEIFA